jgi:hypothetical protein
MALKEEVVEGVKDCGWQRGGQEEKKWPGQAELEIDKWWSLVFCGNFFP